MSDVTSNNTTMPGNTLGVAPTSYTNQPFPPAAPPAQQPPAIHVAPATIPGEILSELTRMRQEREALAAEIKKRDAAEAEAKGLLAQLNEKVALTEREKADLAAGRRADKIRADARMAAMAADAVDPDDVVALVAARLTLDDKGQVVSDDGKPVAEYVKSYLAAKPHMAKPRVAQGSGASPFPAVAPTGGPPKFDLSTAEGMTAFARFATYTKDSPPPQPKPAA